MQDPEFLSAIERVVRECGGKPFRFGKGSSPCYWVPAAALCKASEAIRRAAPDPSVVELEAILGARVLTEFLLTYVLRIGGRLETFLRVTGSLESDWNSVSSIWRSARAEEEALSSRFGMVFR